MRRDGLRKRAEELELLMGEVAYQRMQKAEAVLLLIWDDLPVYFQAAERVGKQTELIRLLDAWALTQERMLDTKLK